MGTPHKTRAVSESQNLSLSLSSAKCQFNMLPAFASLPAIQIRPEQRWAIGGQHSERPQD